MSTGLIIVLGSGGVGKTTTSASMALALAQHGFKTVVITVDPAKRLAQALGLKSLSNEAARVFEHPQNGGYADALWLDPTFAFDELVRRLGGTSPNVAKVLSHRLFKIIRDQLGGIEEYLGIDKVLRLMQEGTYDYCILDTPPSRHALDFLESPKHLLRFFDDSVIRYFISEEEANVKTNFFKRILKTGKSQALEIFKNFLGKSFIAELGELLTYLKPVRDSLKKSASDIEEILRSSRSKICLVSLLEPYPLDEVRLLKSELLVANLPEPNLLLLNKALPKVFPSELKQIGPVWQKLFSQHQIQERLRQNISEQFKTQKVIEIGRFSAQKIDLEKLQELGSVIINPWVASEAAFFSKT